MRQHLHHQVLYVLEVVLGVDGDAGVVVLPDIQPGLMAQAWRPGEEGYLGKAVGAPAGFGGEAGVADRYRLADQIGGQPCAGGGQNLVVGAAEGRDGAVDPQGQCRIRQRPVVFLAQTGGWRHIGIGDVHLDLLCAEGFQLPGYFATQTVGEDIKAGLAVTPEEVDDFLHGNDLVRLAHGRAGRTTMRTQRACGIVRLD
ncbi:hypothetical protein D3C81_1541650 [compost metagenome]